MATLQYPDFHARIAWKPDDEVDFLSNQNHALPDAEPTENSISKNVF